MKPNYKEILQKHNLDKTTWTFKGFHGIPFTFYYVGLCPLSKKYYGDQCKKTMFFASKDYVKWYWADDEMRRLRELLIKNVNNDPDYLKRLRSDWEKKLRHFDKILSKIDNTDLEKIRDKGLFKLYDDFLIRYIDEFGMAIIVQDAFSMYSAEFLEPAFMKVLKDKFSEYYSLLMSPVEDSFLSTELKSRLNILKQVNKTGFDSDKVKKMLKQHQKNFFWKRNNYAKQPVLDIDLFKEEIKSMTLDPDKELKRIDNEIKETIEKKEKLIKKLKLSKELVNLIRITESFTYIQDERKKYVLISNHYQRLFMEQIAKRKNLPIKMVEYLVYPETKEDKIDKEKLKKRYESFVCIQDNDGFYIYEGKEVDNLHKQLFETKKQEITEIKGLGASPGKATGKVKIIHKTHDIINFKDGDILVSSMTRPEMVVAMEKAAAIITDEGGITSHAAIVSRELGIPCIIGTKIATKVLKDGDKVEVDADNGVVRKK